MRQFKKFSYLIHAWMSPKPLYLSLDTQKTVLYGHQLIFPYFGLKDQELNFIDSKWLWHVWRVIISFLLLSSLSSFFFIQSFEEDTLFRDKAFLLACLHELREWSFNYGLHVFQRKRSNPLLNNSSFFCTNINSHKKVALKKK